MWVKILEFVGMLFIYLKVTSKQIAPEVSIIHCYYQDKLATFIQSQILILLESIAVGYYQCPLPHHHPLTLSYI